MGSSSRAFAALLLASATVAAQEPAPATAPTAAPAQKRVLPHHAEIVLAGGELGELVGFGLGNGGIRPGTNERLRWSKDGCTTTGGVRVECREAGVKLTFPAGREVLVAPDGFLHLRSGEAAGPFAGGVELRLGDGACVRIVLAQDEHQHRLRDVVVIQDGHAAQPWRRGESASETPRIAPWAGVRVACCGDGGDLFRAIALGPLVVLDRVLVAADRAEQSPQQRLVVTTAPLLYTLALMPRQHRDADAPVRSAVGAIEAVADRGDLVFLAGSALQRAEHKHLRWLLNAGFELKLDLDGPLGWRLQLFPGDTPEPMVEWTLNGDGAAFMPNPRDDQLGVRWLGNGTRMPKLPTDLQAKDDLFERGYALKVVRRLLR